MKRSRFSEEQIAFALRQVEAGSPVGASSSTSFARGNPWKMPSLKPLAAACVMSV